MAMQRSWGRSEPRVRQGAQAGESLVGHCKDSGPLQVGRKTARGSCRGAARCFLSGEQAEGTDRVLQARGR